MLQQIASGLNLNDCMAEENFNTELVWLFREVTLCVQNAEKFLTNHDVCKAPYYLLLLRDENGNVKVCCMFVRRVL